mmetsp:Transcript_20926/g.66746  ORF Transcript_20926/g.66746 Transcript_20926/m.66746 type:complete len:268 (+) Transcript_20926:1471-2274(+)
MKRVLQNAVRHEGVENGARCDPLRLSRPARPPHPCIEHCGGDQVLRRARSLDLAVIQQLGERWRVTGNELREVLGHMELAMHHPVQRPSTGAEWLYAVVQTALNFLPGDVAGFPARLLELRAALLAQLEQFGLAVLRGRERAHLPRRPRAFYVVPRPKHDAAFDSARNWLLWAEPDILESARSSLVPQVVRVLNSVEQGFKCDRLTHRGQWLGVEPVESLHAQLVEVHHQKLGERGTTCRLVHAANSHGSHLGKAALRHVVDLWPKL